ncbi:alpha/beta-hydrolase [Cristinia sonorae]|uniref:Alpha/beta-hydrolase n=1 Tax=Cristinia sonorae TaxID=1940300 RepID=A0A8K0UX87_9AGAR|nr:alpha/beta-hydrolase [Cristinia sonorae]
MTELTLKQRGLYAVHDTGAPSESDDYLTLVMLHGLAWHAGTFRHMLPFAKKYNARVILVNRRDYPESTPFSDEEMKTLRSAVEVTPEATETLRGFVKDRALDLYQLLETLIKVDNIPKKGGIALGAWSFGTQFTAALLAYGASFPVGDVDVVSYLKYVVNLDQPSHFLGYPPKEGCWNPLLDPTLPEGEGLKIFPRWVSGYFMHGEKPEDIAPRDFSSEILPTLDRMTPEDLQSALFVPPGLPGASDDVLFRAVMIHQLSGEVRKAVIFPASHDSAWSKVKLRHVWGDRSTWSEFWGAVCLEREIEAETKEGKFARHVEFVRLRGANHFSAWDQPERTLRVLLGGEPGDL